MFKPDMVKGDMADTDEESLDNPRCVVTPAGGQRAPLYTGLCDCSRQSRTRGCSNHQGSGCLSFIGLGVMPNMEPKLFWLPTWNLKKNQ